MICLDHVEGLESTEWQCQQTQLATCVLGNGLCNCQPKCALNPKSPPCGSSHSTRRMPLGTLVSNWLEVDHAKGNNPTCYDMQALAGPMLKLNPVFQPVLEHP